MISVGNETVIFKNQRDRCFSIPSFTLNPFCSSRQCAAVRTQAGWMRTPPHRNFPLVFCSIIWNKTREVWHCMKHGSQNTVLILLGGCQIPRLIKHQSMPLKPKHATEAKALQGDKSSMNRVSVKHLQKSFECSSWRRAGFIQISMGWCWSLQRSTLYSKLWNTEHKWGLCPTPETVHHLRLQLSC